MNMFIDLVYVKVYDLRSRGSGHPLRSGLRFVVCFQRVKIVNESKTLFYGQTLTN